jgi:limonene-1,2-epoxide hydrolase
MPTNDRVIRQFSAAVSRMDADELIEYFTPDAVYSLMPMPPPLRGRNAIYQSFVGVPERFRGVRIETVTQTASGSLVIGEFIAHLQLDNRTMALPMADFFELEKGKIKEWREYFDLAAFNMFKSG